MVYDLKGLPSLIALIALGAFSTVLLEQPIERSIETQERFIQEIVESGKNRDSGPLHHLNATLFMRYPLHRNRMPSVRDAPETCKSLRHVVRAILSVRPKCSHRRASLKESL